MFVSTKPVQDRELSAAGEDIKNLPRFRGRFFVGEKTYLACFFTLLAAMKTTRLSATAMTPETICSLSPLPVRLRTRERALRIRPTREISQAR